MSFVLLLSEIGGAKERFFFAQNPTLQSSAEAFAFPGSLAFFCSKIENSVYDSSSPISSSNAQPTPRC
jgi:hypothetical protein